MYQIINQTDQSEDPILSTLARLEATNNRLSLICAASVTGMLIFGGASIYAFHTRADRVEIRNTVDRGGRADVLSSEDVGAAAEWQVATVKAYLQDWAEKRTRKLKNRIQYDYQDVATYLATQPQAQFTGKDPNSFNASQVAIDHNLCAHCPDITATAHDPVLVDTLPATPNLPYDKSYQWDILVDLQSPNHNDRKRVSLNVRFIGQAELSKRLNQLDLNWSRNGSKPSLNWQRTNPLAMEILSYTIKDDAAR